MYSDRHSLQSGDSAIEIKRKANLMVKNMDKNMTESIEINELLEVYGKLHQAAMIASK